MIAYEFELSSRFEPRPGRTRLERVFVLTSVGVSMADLCWMRVSTVGGETVPGVNSANDQPAT